MTTDPPIKRSCSAGHEVPDDQAYCGACGGAASPTQQWSPMPPDRTDHQQVLPTQAPVPRVKRWAKVGAAGLLVAVIIAISVGVASSGNNDQDVSADPAPDLGETDPTADSPTDEPLTRTERCQAVVMDYLVQVPDALNDGYEGGIDLAPIMYKYGSSSAEWRTASSAQAHLISNIILNGNPTKQVADIAITVASDCALYGQQ